MEKSGKSNLSFRIKQPMNLEMLYLKNFLLFSAFCFLGLNFSSQGFSFLPQAEANQDLCPEKDYPLSKINHMSKEQLQEKKKSLVDDIREYIIYNKSKEATNRVHTCRVKVNLYQKALDRLATQERTEAATIKAVSGGESTVEELKTYRCGGETLTQTEIAGTKLVTDLQTKIDLMISTRDRFVNNPDKREDKKGNTKNIFNEPAIKDCTEMIALLGRTKNNLEQCNTTVEEMETKGDEFRKNCTKFSSSGKMKCSLAIMACEMCPSEEDFEDYDCVKIHNNTTCPAKSGEELERAKEERKDIHDDIEKMQEDIAKKENDFVSEENDLNERLSIQEQKFMDIVSDLEREVEENKAVLEDHRKKRTSQMKKNIAEALSEVQAKIDNFLSVAHSFENAITKANREYREKRREIVLECETQARGRLAQYRQRRRAAIRTGSLQISINDLLRGGRKSFAQMDVALFKKYNSECLSRRGADFEIAETEYNDQLTVIEQEKQKYKAMLERTQREVASLHQQAAQAQNQFVQEYATDMNKILESHQKAYFLEHKKYLKKKNQLLSETKKVAVLHEQLKEQKSLFQNKGMQLVREEGLISYLKSKGVTDDEDEGDQYSETVDSLSAYQTSINIADKKCSEDKEKINEAVSHLTRDISEDDFEEAFGKLPSGQQ